MTDHTRPCHFPQELEAFSSQFQLEISGKGLACERVKLTVVIHVHMCKYKGVAND